MEKLRRLHGSDHLGSVRAAFTDSQTVSQTNDYFAFGKRMDDASSYASDNRYQYNGKESMSLHGSDHLLDYGARMYDTDIARWMQPDPMAEKYYSHSPYAYCYNNPMRFIDPNGMEIADGSQEAWDKIKQALQRAVDRLQKRKDKLKQKEADQKKIDRINNRIAGINSTLATMSVMESSSQMYALLALSSGLGEIRYNSSTREITLMYSGLASFVHEVIHAGQFESGRLAFHSINGKTFGQDVYGEVEAFKAQYAFRPSSVKRIDSSSKIKSMSEITTIWVHGIIVDGENPYTPGGEYNTGLSPVDVNSNRAALMKAYPHMQQRLQKMPANGTLKSLPHIYYKQ